MRNVSYHRQHQKVVTTITINLSLDVISRGPVPTEEQLRNAIQSFLHNTNSKQYGWNDIEFNLKTVDTKENSDNVTVCKT